MTRSRSDALANRSFRLCRRKLLLALSFVACTATRASEAEVGFDVRIDNGRVPENMRRLRVTQGDVVHLRFTVDRPMTLHLHGYDIERRVEPGKSDEITFAARATGRFPLHAHGAGANADQRSAEETPLLYVEVYPR
ncbi:MAG TPA: hypothetical protein VFD67_01195 [Gemmatimonadaceae bacterium]|nr:hypothetical protein [Gemmatimonadaceae bacterium]